MDAEPRPPVTAVEPAPPPTVGGWFAGNFMPVLFVAAVVGLIAWRGLVVWDVALAVLGLGLVIFIHELGHFLAAKFCDVHVETFSIGFGKPIPGCRFKYGETTYKIGWIPLGGFVKMVGEGENADTDEADDDPRSFKNKPVWQRMVIISAGVVMNLILGCACFMVAYSHGVEEPPGIVGGAAIGSPAWEAGIRGGDEIVRIEGNTKPTFDDVRPVVMSTEKGGTVAFAFRDGDGSREVPLVPRRSPGEPYPTVGVFPIEQLMLPKARKGGGPVVRPGSPADTARASDGTPFQPSDRIIASSHDPANPADLKPIPVDTRDPSGTKLDYMVFQRRMIDLRGKPMHVQVERDNLTYVLDPAYTTVIPGVRFQMGRVASIRTTGPAGKATLVSPAEEGPLQTVNADQPDSGDRIIAVEIKSAGQTVRYVDEFSKEKDAKVVEKLFDPHRIGYDLENWAQTATDLNVRLTVLRAPTGATKTGRRVTYDMTWDRELVYSGESGLNASSPTSLSGLGLAYYVDTTIDQADAGNPLQKGDVITEFRFHEKQPDGSLKPSSWAKLKQNHAAHLHAVLLRLAPTVVDFKVQRTGTETTVTVNPVADKTWPSAERGFAFATDTRLHKADDLLDAVSMGLHRTKRTVKVIYQTLYATIFREISTDTLSGPLQIANVSYKIAGYDLWQFILFIGLININLAVVNFLPIPVLDGGHMVFLIYEKIRGKPAPEKLQEWALYVGLGLILSLMAFVIFLDVRKLFF